MNFYKCKICGKEFDTRFKHNGHVSVHSRTIKPKITKSVICKPHICKFCTKEFKCGQSLGMHVLNCRKNPSYYIFRKKAANSKKEYYLSDEAKKNISIGMKLAHKEGRAWNIGKSRWNNKPSYPEQFFIKVIENEFEDKEYQTEFSIGIYSLDFAWIKKKKCIEIDGDQHYRFDEYIKRDKKKDLYLKELGWEVLRIPWKDMFNESKNIISKCKKFIDG